MAKQNRPSEARAMAAGFIPVIAPLCRCVISGRDLNVFNGAVVVALEACKLPATAATCAEIEEMLGVMVNLLLDSPEFDSKPAEDQQMVVDGFERVGSACHAAARSHLHLIH